MKDRQRVLPLTFDINPTKELDSIAPKDSFRLLDETHGKITHVLAFVDIKERIQLLTDLATMMDHDVRFTALKSEGQYANLGPLLKELPPNVTLGNRDNYIKWPQDSVHAYHSPQYGLYGVSPATRSQSSRVVAESTVKTGKVVRVDDHAPKGLILPGGDIMCDEAKVYIGYYTVANNADPNKTKTEVADSISEWAHRVGGGRKMELVGMKSERFQHMDMMARPIGNGRWVSSDKEIAKELSDRGYDVTMLPTRSERIEDAIHLKMKTGGKLPGAAKIMTYTNVEIEDYSGKKNVYMPMYGSNLDDEATRIWKNLGFTVKPIPVQDLFTQNDSLRCNLKVLERRYDK